MRDIDEDNLTFRGIREIKDGVRPLISWAQRQDAMNLPPAKNGRHRATQGSVLNALALAILAMPEETRHAILLDGNARLCAYLLDQPQPPPLEVHVSRPAVAPVVETLHLAGHMPEGKSKTKGKSSR